MAVQHGQGGIALAIGVILFVNVLSVLLAEEGINIVSGGNGYSLRRRAFILTRAPLPPFYSLRFLFFHFLASTTKGCNVYTSASHFTRATMGMPLPLLFFTFLIFDAPFELKLYHAGAAASTRLE